MKDNLKRSILPISLALLYIVAVVILAFYAEITVSDAYIEFNFWANACIIIIFTAPAYLMITSILCWLIEFVKFKEYRYEKRSLIISSTVCGALFLVGAVSFFFLTLGAFN